jgi:hypothetical protein
MSADVHIVAREIVRKLKGHKKAKPFSVAAYTSCNLGRGLDKPLER